MSAVSEERRGWSRRMTKGDRTRRRILDAAAAVFARAGVTAVSMGDVAAAAGMQTGSLYFHFASKDHLIDEVLREGIGQALSHLEQAVDAQRARSASSTVRLRTAIQAHLEALHELSEYASVVLGSATERSLRNEDHYLPQERRYAGYWLDILRDAQEVGVLSANLDVRLVRDLLFGAMNATPLRDREPDEVARTIAALLGIANE